MRPVGTGGSGALANHLGHRRVFRDLPSDFDNRGSHPAAGLEWPGCKTRPEHKTIRSPVAGGDAKLRQKVGKATRDIGGPSWQKGGSRDRRATEQEISSIDRTRSLMMPDVRGMAGLPVISTKGAVRATAFASHGQR